MTCQGCCNKCAVEGYDVAIGSRYVSGVNVVNWPMGRVLMSYLALQICTDYHRVTHT